MHRVIKGLAEVALRTGDLETMARFYGDVVGLELVQRFDEAVFFRITDGPPGEAQMLVLFAASVEPYSVQQPLAEPRVEASTLHHLALAISKEDLSPEHERLKRLGCNVAEASHEWAKVRSLYANDPEGNVVEWVCVDQSL
jgi:catechol-2,3-dioxygenase